MSKSVEEKLQERVDSFVEKLIPKSPAKAHKKIIHDSIWGTQLLQDYEVAVLNTPLLQRLRYIHQTGFCYLTYPSALHTRFDHSLGVLYQANRLSSHLREKYSDKRNPIIDDVSLRKIRLAALLHDCSHGLFSHTSEEVYRLSDDMKNLTSPGGKFEGSSPSEILVHFIFQSAPFKKFFKKLQKDYPLEFELKDLENLILGQGKDTKIGYHTDIINGPFDADKLDYIFRDSHFSGLPMSVDIDRLWYSVEIQTDPEKKESRRLIMNVRGVNSIEQIVFSRMVLTASVYHHHKVRASDCMFKAVIEYCKNHNLQLCGRDLHNPDDFLYMTDDMFYAESTYHPNQKVKELIENIVHRRLFKRALVISMNSIKSQMQQNKEQTTLIQHLIEEKYDALRKLAEKIWKEAGRPGLVEEIWVDYPRDPKLKDLEYTLVNSGSRDKPKISSLRDFIPLPQWSNLYLLNKWKGYIFCPEKYVSRVAKAAKTVLQEKYKVTFNQFATQLANHSHDST